MSQKTPLRRKTRQVFVGSVAVGANAPISVQSMTNTLTVDINNTISQILEMESAGADIVRVSCPDEESSLALKKIVSAVNVPVVADIHFHYKHAITAAENGAACLRINPGNIGSIDRVREVIKAAKDHNCSIRIGVNGGSLEKHLLEKYKEPSAEAMVESALSQAKLLEDNDFLNFKISVKASDTLMTMKAYQLLSQATEAPLHIGITEAGGLRAGTVKSAFGLGSLLAMGIGDTMRVSLTAPVAEEIKVAYEILRMLDLRHRGVRIISCPTCARKGFDVEAICKELEVKLEHVLKPFTIAVLGCVVNGIGEAEHADVGCCGGGNGKALLFEDGKQKEAINASDVVSKITEIILKKAGV